MDLTCQLPTAPAFAAVGPDPPRPAVAVPALFADTGESYGGVFVPLLASELLKVNKRREADRQGPLVRLQASAGRWPLYGCSAVRLYGCSATPRCGQARHVRTRQADQWHGPVSGAAVLALAVLNRTLNGNDPVVPDIPHAGIRRGQPGDGRRNRRQRAAALRSRPGRGCLVSVSLS